MLGWHCCTRDASALVVSLSCCQIELSSSAVCPLPEKATPNAYGVYAPKYSGRPDQYYQPPAHNAERRALAATQNAALLQEVQGKRVWNKGSTRL